MIGSNVPAIGGISTAFQYAKEWGCEVIQLYITPSRTWKVPDLDDDYVNQFKKLVEVSKVKCIVAHVPFLVNLASSDVEKRKKSVQRLMKEYERAGELNIPYIVLHPGSCGELDKEQGIAMIIEGLNYVLGEVKDNNVKILLETMAGQGTSIGSTFHEIRRIIEGIWNQEKIGVCFDTAHVFQAGYDISSLAGYDKTFKEFESIIGIEKIKVFHVNDSKSIFASKRDLHEKIGKGEIGLSFFRRLLNDDRFWGIPKILEVPDRDKSSHDNIKILKSLRV